MNREIEFRGFDGREWRYGDLEYNRKDDVARIHTYKEDGSYGKQYLVDPYTVGEFAGLTDKNGVKIFEGDVVKRISVNSDSSLYYDCGVVIFDNGNASFKLSMYKCVFNGRDIGLFDDDDDATCNFVTNVVYDGQTPQEDEYYYEVIGNVYDNSDLLLSK
jgi:uncharacterized phage protein (TIGR01671 family)